MSAVAYLINPLSMRINPKIGKMKSALEPISDPVLKSDRRPMVRTARCCKSFPVYTWAHLTVQIL